MRKKNKAYTTIYEVVINYEGQYSIWPRFKKIPLGWKSVGRRGLKKECLDYIDRVWTDMRPLSLRKKKTEMDSRHAEFDVEHHNKLGEERKQFKDPIDHLVKFLSEGDHPIEVSLRPEKSIKHFKKAIDREYLHIKFTDTQGGTEIGFNLDKEKCDLEEMYFGSKTRSIHVEGNLFLNYVKVRCIVHIELKDLNGYGHLKILDE